MLLLALVALSASSAAAAAAATADSLPVQLHVRRSIDSPLANVHLEFERAVEGRLDYTYGPCESTSAAEAWQHIAVADGSAADRLVWRLRDEAPSGGCLAAWAADKLMGRGAAVEVPHRRRKLKRATPWTVPMDNSSGIDTEGPWFDGVKLLMANNMTAVDVDQAKRKKIAIVGGGMAGLMIWTSLSAVGMRNVSIVEASQRLGGRVATQYIGDPSERQYQDE